MTAANVMRRWWQQAHGIRELLAIAFELVRARRYRRGPRVEERDLLD
jgi:hypothetical protein